MERSCWRNTGLASGRNRRRFGRAETSPDTRRFQRPHWAEVPVKENAPFFKALYQHTARCDLIFFHFHFLWKLSNCNQWSTCTKWSLNLKMQFLIALLKLRLNRNIGLSNSIWKKTRKEISNLSVLFSAIVKMSSQISGKCLYFLYLWCIHTPWKGL